jgi:hypothetical protein
MRAGVIGHIATPAQGNRRPDGAPWCADNGCFSEAFNVDKWWRFLVRNAGQTDPPPLFATAPDAVGDHQRSYRRADPWLDPIRDLGYPVAWVAQNGATLRRGSVPWERFDALFIGGTTEWKLGDFVRCELIPEAKARSKWVHMGRVNSFKRYAIARDWGCDSADGTTLARYPVTIHEVLSWPRRYARLRGLDSSTTTRPRQLEMFGDM